MSNDLHSILVYGPSGVGKSLFVEQLVRELLKKYPSDAKARVVTCEHYKAYSALCAEGKAEVWKVNEKDHPFEQLAAAVDGMWPTSTIGGVADTSSKLVTAKEVPPIRVHEGVATFGLYIGGSYAEGGLADRIGKGENFGPPDSASEGAITLQDGELSVGKLSRNNFGFIQNQLTGFIQRSQKKGGFCIWTTHEDDVDEKIGSKQAGTLRKTGKAIIGPEGFGQAMTNTMGRDFDEVWRIVTLPQLIEDPKTNETRAFIERRLYVKDHIDPTFGIMAKAKNSLGLDGVPDYFRLTDTGARLGMRRVDAAAVVVEKLGL